MDQSYVNELPDIYNKLKKRLLFISAVTIQKYACKMFYDRYGIFWRDTIDNFNEYFDYYYYLNNIVDPGLDYVDYYHE